MLLNTPFKLNKPGDGGAHVTEELAAYLDYELPEPDRERVREHLRRCPQCENELATLRATKQLLRDLPAVPVPRSFKLNPDQVAALGSRPARVVAPPPGRAFGLPRLALAFRLASAACAFVLLLSIGTLSLSQNTTPSAATGPAPALRDTQSAGALAPTSMPTYAAAAATPPPMAAAAPTATTAAAAAVMAPSSAATAEGGAGTAPQPPNPASATGGMSVASAASTATTAPNAPLGAGGPTAKLVPTAAGTPAGEAATDATTAAAQANSAATAPPAGDQALAGSGGSSAGTTGNFTPDNPVLAIQATTPAAATTNPVATTATGSGLGLWPWVGALAALTVVFALASIWAARRA